MFHWPHAISTIADNQIRVGKNRPISRKLSLGFLQFINSFTSSFFFASTKKMSFQLTSMETCFHSDYKISNKTTSAAICHCIAELSFKYLGGQRWIATFNSHMDGSNQSTVKKSLARYRFSCRGPPYYVTTSPRQHSRFQFRPIVNKIIRYSFNEYEISCWKNQLDTLVAYICVVDDQKSLVDTTWNM